jgi:8-oxo-dGTP diphosphatase
MQKVTAAVIEEGGRVLIARRKVADRFGGRWEFPGGKLEPGEAPEAGLRRELREELGVETRIGAFLGAFPFESSRLSIELLAYRVSIEHGELRLVDHDEIVWARPDDLPGYDFTEPDRPLLALLAAGGAP